MDNGFKDRYKVIDFEKAKQDKEFGELLLKSSVVPIERVNMGQYGRPGTESTKVRFTASEGALKEAREKSERAKANRRQKRAARKRRKIIGLALAGALAVGGMSGYHAIKENSKPKLSDLVEQGADVRNLGMGQKTMDSLAQYEEYFSDADSIKDGAMLGVVNDLYDLNLQMIKDKIASATGHSAEDLKVWLNSDNADGITYVSIELTENENKKIIFSGTSGELSFLKGTDELPEDVIEQAILLYNIGNLQDKVSKKGISDSNAWKEARGYYNKMDRFASKQLIQDKDGNLAVLDYGEVEKTNSNNIQHEDNER